MQLEGIICVSIFQQIDDCYKIIRYKIRSANWYISYFQVYFYPWQKDWSSLQDCSSFSECYPDFQATSVAKVLGCSDCFARWSQPDQTDHKGDDYIHGAASTKDKKLVCFQEPAGKVEHLVQQYCIQQIPTSTIHIADDDRERDESNHEEYDIEKQIDTLKTRHEPQR